MYFYNIQPPGIKPGNQAQEKQNFDLSNDTSKPPEKKRCC